MLIMVYPSASLQNGKYTFSSLSVSLSLSLFLPLYRSFIYIYLKKMEFSQVEIDDMKPMEEEEEKEEGGKRRRKKIKWKKKIQAYKT